VKFQVGFVRATSSRPSGRPWPRRCLSSPDALTHMAHNELQREGQLWTGGPVPSTIRRAERGREEGRVSLSCPSPADATGRVHQVCRHSGLHLKSISHVSQAIVLVKFGWHR